MEKDRFFRSRRMTAHVTRIEGVLHEYMYLVTGKERALLIDTGCGAGNLRAYVRGLTPLPVTVLLTHGHFDHMGGSYGFGEVYIGEKEARPTPIHYEPGEVRRELALGGIALRQEEMTEKKPLKFHWLRDGMVFDLGGVTAEAILCPGHTPETYAVLLGEERLLLTGDACHSITYLFFENSLSVAAYQRNLLHLKEREEEWDALLLSHPVGEAPREMLDQVIDVCGEILEGKSARIPFAFRGQEGRIAKAVSKNMLRTDGKLGNIIYNPFHVYDEI